MDAPANLTKPTDSKDSVPVTHWSITFNNPVDGVHYTARAPAEARAQDRDAELYAHAAESDSDASSVDEDIPPAVDNTFEILLVLPSAEEQAAGKLTKSAVEVSWFIGQLERGENGTPHIQMHVNFKRPVIFSVVKKLLDNSSWKGAHLEKVHSIKDHMLYVVKDDTRVLGPYRSPGAPAKGAVVERSRTDVLAFKTALDATIGNPMGIKKVWGDHFGLMLRNFKGAQMYVQVHNKPIARPDHEVVVLYGEPGTGKSTLAVKLCKDLLEGEDPFFKGTGKWFDNYSSQLGMIWDDFDCSGERVQAIKNILDKTPCTVEIKGGTLALCTTLTIITTNTHPLRWGASRDKPVSRVDREAIIRRCHFFAMDWETATGDDGYAPFGTLNEAGRALETLIHSELRKTKDKIVSDYRGMAGAKRMQDTTSEEMVMLPDNRGNDAIYPRQGLVTPAPTRHQNATPIIAALMRMRNNRPAASSDDDMAQEPAAQRRRVDSPVRDNAPQGGAPIAPEGSVSNPIML